MIIYIAGKMTDNPNFMEQFRKAEEKILSANNGRRVQNEVINPIKFIYPHGIPEGRIKRESIMRVCKAYLDMADAIYMLSGWEESPGARMELTYYINAMGEFADVYVEGGSGEKYDRLFGKVEKGKD